MTGTKVRAQVQYVRIRPHSGYLATALLHMVTVDRIREDKTYETTRLEECRMHWREICRNLLQHWVFVKKLGTVIPETEELPWLFEACWSRSDWPVTHNTAIAWQDLLSWLDQSEEREAVPEIVAAVDAMIEAFLQLVDGE